MIGFVCKNDASYISVQLADVIRICSWFCMSTNFLKKSKKDGVPNLIVANTIKGKGFSFSENNNNWHHAIMTKTIYEQGKKELADFNDN